MGFIFLIVYIAISPIVILAVDEVKSAPGAAQRSVLVGVDDTNFECASSRIAPVASCTIDQGVFETKSLASAQDNLGQSVSVFSQRDMEACDTVLDEYRQEYKAYWLVAKQFEVRRLAKMNCEKAADQVQCCRCARRAALFPRYLYLSYKYDQSYHARELAWERLGQQRRVVEGQFNIIRMRGWQTRILMDQIETSVKQEGGRPN